MAGRSRYHCWRAGSNHSPIASWMSMTRSALAKAVSTDPSTAEPNWFRTHE